MADRSMAETLGKTVLSLQRAETRAERAEAVIARATIVAEHWRDWAMEKGDTPMPTRVTAHPLALVLAALGGETDPVQLAVQGPDADRLRAAGSPGAA